MPIYEFHCERCGEESELLVRSSDWKGTACPHCGSKRLTKKLSVFASSAADDSAPACGVSAGSGCCGCAAGRPHRH